MQVLLIEFKRIDTHADSLPRLLLAHTIINMMHEETHILRQQLHKAFERITYLENIIIAKDKTIHILQEHAQQFRDTHSTRHQISKHFSSLSYDSIDEEQRLREQSSLPLGESGNFDDTLDQNQVGEKATRSIPELQKIPFFDHNNNSMTSMASVYWSSPILDNTEVELRHHLHMESQTDMIANEGKNQLVDEGMGDKSLFRSFTIITSDEVRPLTLYSYPDNITHEEGILQLIYPPTLLKPIGRCKGYNDLIRTVSTTIRDRFIVPLKNPELADTGYSEVGDYQFLIGFEVEDMFWNEGVLNAHPVFYCFLTAHKCIKLFYELLSLVITTVNGAKNQLALSQGITNTSSFSRNNLLEKAIYNSQLPTLMSRVYKNKFQYNQHLCIKWNKEQTLIEQIPPKQDECDLIFMQPVAVSLTTIKVSCKFSNHPPFQSNLIILMLVYFVCEKRIVIYSTSKEKVSLCFLVMLQLIHPMEFVNPVIQGQFREELLEYLDAPMAVVIGLWGDKKSSRKIDISLKKSPKSPEHVFREEMERQRLKDSDGLVFNLDGDKVNGEADDELNAVSSQLFNEVSRYSSSEFYRRAKHLVGMVLRGERTAEWATVLRRRIESTQMHCYFTERTATRSRARSVPC